MKEKGKILIVDDEQNMLDTLSHNFSAQGYAVITASDGKTALEKAAKEKPEICIADIKMPGLGGNELLKKVKELDPGIEVIIITGYSSVETAVESLRCGAFDYLTKPFDMENMVSTVERARERRRLKESTDPYELSKILFSTLDMDELAKNIVEVTMKFAGSDDASILLLDDEGKLYIAASKTLDEPIIEETRIAIGERIAGWAMKNKESVILVNGLENDDRFSDVKGREIIKSAIVVPLRKGEECIGVLNVNRINIDDVFSERDLREITMLASLFALAISNTELHREMKSLISEISFQKDFVENIIKSMIDTLIVANPDATIKTVNRATLDLFGYTEEELVGKPVGILFEEEEERLLFKGTKWEKLLKEGAVRNYEITYRTKSEENIPVSFSGSVMRDKEGKIAGIVGIARDMRQVKQLQAQLIQAEKLAELGQLAAGIAHELNQPLTGIMTFSNLLEEDIKDEEAFTEDINTIKEQAKRMADIIKNIRTFARQSKVEDFSPLNINEPVNAAFTLCTEQLKKHNIKLTQNFAPDLPSVSGDASQIEQVITNLITNARDALNEFKTGKLKEIVVATNYLPETKQVKITFSDNGPGIPSDIIDRIFDPFVTAKTSGRGTGLGLSISYGIVERHGGRIMVKSPAGNGRGTEFKILFPVVEK